ncbi:hypothetical protein PGT21_022027 [Puccinia graminis f. sp. tritici]|uniref:Uncharacterized protein n=1 Tax=Puccinia graminis f. sp. tritici TaxID=56615 RepID=A0A5B0QNH3_PUCGR|nr:hypothetical protein PGT21_022027 [Puccinia graminis f. sp. tritici]
MVRGLSNPFYIYHAFIICHLGIVNIKHGLCLFGSRPIEPSFSLPRDSFGCAGGITQPSLPRSNWGTRRARSQKAAMDVIVEQTYPSNKNDAPFRSIHWGGRQGRSKRARPRRPRLSESIRSTQTDEWKNLSPDIVKNIVLEIRDRSYPTRKRSRLWQNYRSQSVTSTQSQGDRKYITNGFDLNAPAAMSGKVGDNSPSYFSSGIQPPLLYSPPPQSDVNSATQTSDLTSDLSAYEKPKSSAHPEFDLNVTPQMNDDVEVAPTREFERHALSDMQSGLNYPRGFDLNIPPGSEGKLPDNLRSYHKLPGSWNQASHLLSPMLLTTNLE